jgi:hypothetical protein
MKFPIEVTIPAHVELHCRIGEEQCEWFKIRAPFRCDTGWLDIEYIHCYHPFRDAKPYMSTNGNDVTPYWCPLLREKEVKK